MDVPDRIQCAYEKIAELYKTYHQQPNSTVYPIFLPNLTAAHLFGKGDVAGVLSIFSKFNQPNKAHARKIFYKNRFMIMLYCVALFMDPTNIRDYIAFDGGFLDFVQSKLGNDFDRNNLGDSSVFIHDVRKIARDSIAFFESRNEYNRALEQIKNQIILTEADKPETGFQKMNETLKIIFAQVRGIHTSITAFGNDMRPRIERLEKKMELRR